jgi:RimJ/RimL family protein N-acetyltransferase
MSFVIAAAERSFGAAKASATAMTASARLTALPKRVRRNASDYGLALTSRKIAAALVGPVYRRRVYRIYRIRLEPEVLKRPLVEHGVSLRLLTPQDIGAITQVELLAEWLAGSVGDRLRSGDICVAAFSGAQLLGFNLISFHHADIAAVSYRLRFQPNEAWSVHVGVRRDVRRLGIATAIRLTAFQELYKRGIHRFYGGTFPSNTAAIRFQQRLGFRELADIQYTRVLIWRWWRCLRRPGTNSGA